MNEDAKVSESHERGVILGRGQDAKVSELHERGVILGRRCAGDVAEDMSKCAYRLSVVSLFRKGSL